MSDYELVYRCPDPDVLVDIIPGAVPGQSLITLFVDQVERTDDEAGALLLIGDIRRMINRLEAAQEAIERKYGL